MNLTRVISSRRLDFEPDIKLKGKIVCIAEIGAEINLQQDWYIAPTESFAEYKANYIFPEIDELSRKDKKTYKESIFPPMLLLVSSKKCEKVFKPIILTYLYRREALTGATLLHIRSINKFEMMWAPNFIDAHTSERTSPKVFKLCGYPTSLSKTLNFVFRSNLYSEPIESRLTILTIDLVDFVLAFYIVDNYNCQLTEGDIEEFIQNIKIKDSPNN